MDQPKRIKPKEDILAYIRNGDSMTKKQQLRLVVGLSLPTILAQLATIVMQYIDASMVGHLGANASAAIGLVASSTWLLGGLCLAGIAGFAVQAAQSIGAGSVEIPRKIFRQSVRVIILLSLALSCIGIMVSGILPGLLCGDGTLQSDASVYFLIYASFLPIMAMNRLAGGMLQSSGNMKIPSVLNILMCLLDVGLNALLIFSGHEIQLFGSVINIPGAGLGVAGAALGTGLAELITGGIMMFMVCFKIPVFRLTKGDSSLPSKAYIKKAFRISLPIAFEDVMVIGAMIVSTRIVAPLGVVAIAAHSFAITAESLCYMPGYGIGNAATTLVGQSIGAGRKQLTREFARMTLNMGMLIMTISGALMYLAAPAMLSFLTPVKEVQELGIQVLRIEAFAEPLYAASIVASGGLRGAGDTFIPGLMNFVSMWAVRLPLSYFLALRFGLQGVWIAMCAELCFRGTILLVRLYREKWLETHYIKEIG